MLKNLSDRRIYLTTLILRAYKFEVESVQILLKAGYLVSTGHFNWLLGIRESRAFEAQAA